MCLGRLANLGNYAESSHISWRGLELVGLSRYTSYQMAHRNDPSELYVVQDSQRRDDSIEGYGRLRGRTNSRPIYGSDALKPAAAKRDPSAGFTKKAIATGPKKKRKPPKVPWKKPKGKFIPPYILVLL